jgi:thioredoxin reductase (NADPH)
MQDRAFANDKIRFVWNAQVIDILGDDRVTGLRVRDIKTGGETALDASGVFIAIGHEPRTELFDGQLDLDDEGYLVVDAPTTHTNIPGVFGSGDVVDHRYRQAITAAGTGSAAALDAERWLQDQDTAELTHQPEDETKAEPALPNQSMSPAEPTSQQA